MKAIVYTSYGPPDVLRLQDVEKPISKDDEVLVEIHAASVNAADWHLLRADPFPVRFMAGLTKPKNTILGADIAGTIEAVGKDVKEFKAGDEVFGDISQNNWGGFAEFVCTRADALVRKPKNISFEEAAAVPLAALAALHGLRDKGHIKRGQKVLINGASGGVGTFAVQIAKAFGAEVTAVCSTKKMDMVRSLGADYVIDYTKEDFTKNGQHYDLIFAANGNRSIFDYKRALSPKGVYVMSGGSSSQMSQSMLLGNILSVGGDKDLSPAKISKPDQKDLEFMKELIEAGKVRSVIDKRYPLSDVADAIRYVEEGHAKGKVVITIR